MAPPKVERRRGLMTIDPAAAKSRGTEVELRSFLWSIVALLSGTLCLAHAALNG